MQKVKEWSNALVAVTPNSKLRVLVIGDPELVGFMDGDLFDDNCSDLSSFPEAPGLYQGTIEYWFQQGYFEGHEADGESGWNYVFVNPKNVTPIR